MIELSTRPGEEHTFRVVKARYAGTYASVWFNEPNLYTKPNRSVEGAPEFYIEFSWTDHIKPVQAKAFLDAWLANQGLYGKLAHWEKTYHIKYFYQGVVGRADGCPIGRKHIEFWQEFNWRLGEPFEADELPVAGEVTVLSGLEQYRFLPFRVVGVGAVHPIDWPGWVFLRSNFKYQYLVKEVKNERR